MFEGKYTTVGSRSTLHTRVANRDLSRHLGTYHQRTWIASTDIQHVDDIHLPIKEEIINAFETSMPECSGTVRVFPLAFS